MKEVVIVGGARTPIGSFGGQLKTVSAKELGKLAMKGVFKKLNLRPEAGAGQKEISPDKIRDAGRASIEEEAYDWDESAAPVTVDEVIMGNVLTAGLGQNPARQAMIMAGIPKETPAFTVNKVCASGLKSIALAAASIMIGQAECILAGGQESMSNAPMALPKARWGYRMELTGSGEINDLMVLDGLWEIFYGYHMGMTAENIAQTYGISRQEQDELGVLSHTRAREAIANNLFEDEIVPVPVRQKKEVVNMITDERPMDTNMEKMAKLRPAFTKDGSVTAGNASGINDGAAAVLFMSREKADSMGLAPMAKVRAFASAGIDPAYMGLGPIPAVRKVLAETGLFIGDLDLVELNEAFAAQAIACCRELGLDPQTPNPLGSGISLGHPIGATGARQTVTAIHHMKRTGAKNALVSMCIGGGMGMAMLLEKA